MSKSNRNTGKVWEKSDIDKMRDLANRNTPTRVIGFKLGRTESAIYSKASQEGISLKPSNRSPYN